MLLRVVAQSLKPVQILANVEKVATTPNNVASVFTGLYLALPYTETFQGVCLVDLSCTEEKEKKASRLMNI